MKRPPWMSRGLWFAQRRNRRGRPVTLRTFGEATARVLSGKELIEDLANRPGAFAAFATRAMVLAYEADLEAGMLAMSEEQP